MQIALANSPITYTAAAEMINDLPALMSVARQRHGLTVKTQAPLVGVTVATLTRLDSTKPNPTGATILACLRWLTTNG